MVQALQAVLGSGSGPRRIADIGCATGEFTSLLVDHVAQGGAVTGYDLSPTAVARAAQRHPLLDFRVGSFEQAAADLCAGADVVSCLEVLYYIAARERPAAIAALRATVKPGGLVLASSMLGGVPYMDCAGLGQLFADGFHLLDAGTLSLWPLTALEKFSMKFRHQRIGADPLEFFPQGRGYARLVRRTRLCRRLFGSRADSHAFIIARRSPEG